MSSACRNRTRGVKLASIDRRCAGKVGIVRCGEIREPLRFAILCDWQLLEDPATPIVDDDDDDWTGQPRC
jgi:hypothetical protein